MGVLGCFNVYAGVLKRDTKCDFVLCRVITSCVVHDSIVKIEREEIAEEEKRKHLRMRNREINPTALRMELRERERCREISATAEQVIIRKIEAGNRDREKEA